MALLGTPNHPREDGVGRGWLRTLWSQLYPTFFLQMATVGLGPPQNCTSPSHCSTKGIEVLHNVTRQKCEWVWRAWAGLGHRAWGWEVQVGLRVVHVMEMCWSPDVGKGWEMLLWGPGMGLSAGAGL